MHLHSTVPVDGIKNMAKKEVTELFEQVDVATCDHTQLDGSHNNSSQS